MEPSSSYPNATCLASPLQEWNLFAMPMPGYLGFPPFAAECFVLFAFCAPILNSVTRKFGGSGSLGWFALDL